jgi:TonB family protein
VEVKLKKSETYGIIGTAIFAVLLLLILLFCTLSHHFIKEEQEGLSVNFGETLEAQGRYEPAPASVLETSVPKPQLNPTPPIQEAVKTQNFEESLALAEARKQDKEKQRVEEEQRKIEQQKIKAKASGAFSGAGSTASTGQGTSSGSGNQGNPFGDHSTNIGNAGGVGSSFKLGGGRGIVGAIPRPADNTPVEGVVVVDIAVDTGGGVIAATIGQGTTITEANVRNAALNAARKAKFTKGEKIEVGTITYRFILN